MVRKTAALILALLVVPAAADAKPKFVTGALAGPHPVDFAGAVPERLQNVVAFNDFFPHRLTVHVGDPVSLGPAGSAFHTIDIPARGQKPLPLITPATSVVNGALDAAGNAFWFNGRSQLGFNPALTHPEWGKTFTYNGRKRIESGLPPAGVNPRPLIIRFSKAGTVTYFCDVHPGMKGVIRVVPKTKKAPSYADAIRAARKQVTADAQIAQALAQTAAPPNKVLLGATGNNGVEYLGMLGPSGAVPAGNIISFDVSPHSSEQHTATFGPGSPSDASSYLGQLAGTFSGNGPLNPITLYPSDPAGSVATMNSQAHGNGFWNSGTLGAGASASVRLDSPGQYEFFCLVHPQMHGTLTVQ